MLHIEKIDICNVSRFTKFSYFENGCCLKVIYGQRSRSFTTHRQSEIFRVQKHYELAKARRYRKYDDYRILI